LEEVERLLKENCWSQRKIARETGVSRSTVNNIARGHRPRCEELPGVHPTGPLVRCPGTVPPKPHARRKAVNR